MGNICGMDIYQRLCTQYLEDFTKIITLQQSRQLLDSKVPDIKTRLTLFYDSYQKNAHMQIEQKASVAYNFLDETASHLRKEYENKIKSIQANGQTIQLMLHIEQLKKPIQESKNNAKTQVSNQRAKMFTQIDQVHQKLLQEFQSQKPFVKLYCQLPPQVQLEVQIKAQQRFKQKIDQSNQITLKQINDLIGEQKFLKDLKIFDPTGQLHQLIEQSKRKINDYKINLIQKLESIGTGQENLKSSRSKLNQNSQK